MGQGHVGHVSGPVSPSPETAAARLVRAADRALKFVAAASCAVLTLCVLLGVASRGIGEPVAWTDELSRFLMVWVAMFGWILASRRHAHIRIRFFHDMLPPFAWALLEIAMQFSVVLFGLLVVGYGAELIERNSDVDAISLPITNMWFYVPLVIAGGVAAIQAAADIASAWAGRKSRPA